MKQDIREMDSSFKFRVYDLLSLDKQGEQRKQFNSIMDEFGQNSYFDIYKEKLGNKMQVTFFKPLFRRLVIESGIEQLGGQTDYLQDVFSEAEKQIRKDYNKAKIKKPQLIMLGRGKVSAGYRFDKLDQRNIRVDSLRSRIVFIGMTPEILSCDINPWLVPELGIKGFEIIDYNRKADNPSILQRVKQACLDSLLAQALSSDILALAKTNAEQNLKQFFSIILDNPDIVVKIESDELDYYVKYVVSDSLIDPSQLAGLEQLVNMRFSMGQQDTSKISDLMDSLCKCKLRIGIDSYVITSFSLPVYKWLKTNLSKTGTDADQLKIAGETIKSQLQKNSAWFGKLFGTALLKNNHLSHQDTLTIIYSQMKEMSKSFLNKQ